MLIGTAPAVTNESSTQVKIPRSLVVTSLSIQTRVAPGTGHSSTFTLRKNGVDTPLTVTLTDTATAGSSTNASVSYAIGDLISLKAVTVGPGNGSTDIAVTASIY